MTKANKAPLAKRLTFTPDELAEYLHLSRATIYKGLQDGTIPHRRLNKKYIIGKSAIDEWLKNAGGTIA